MFVYENNKAKANLNKYNSITMQITILFNYSSKLIVKNISPDKTWITKNTMYIRPSI